MSELMPPEWVLGCIAMVSAVVYAAWHEYAARNYRDARLLATVGAIGLAGSAAAWLS